MTFAEQLLDAVGEVGMDLVDMAEKVRFPKSFLRRTLPVAACMAVLLGAGLYVQSWLSGQEAEQLIQIPGAEEPAVEAETAPVQLPPPVGCYLLDLPGEPRRMAALDPAGTVLTEAEEITKITDTVSGETLGLLCATVYGADSDWASSQRIICDLQGKELSRISARSIQVADQVIAVEFGREKTSLYRRDGTLIRSDLVSAVAMSDCMIGWLADGSAEVYDPDGQLQLSLDRITRWEHWDGVTAFAQDEGGRWGVLDSRGNWILEPGDRVITELAQGWIVSQQNGVRCLMELQSGWSVTIPENMGVRLCGELLVWSEFSEEQTLNWVTDRSGRVLVPRCSYIEVLDDEKDQIPELFLAWDGADVTVCRPDGTQGPRFSQVGGLQALSSRAAVYTKTVQDPDTGEWVVDFAIMDLQSGQANRQFPKPYDQAEPLGVCGLFYGCYTDETGEHMDLLDETGRVLLEDLQISERTGSAYLGDDVFLTNGGYRRTDGSWLYRFE